MPQGHTLSGIMQHLKMPESPRILIAYPEKLPSTKARSVQTICTANALSALMPVTLTADFTSEISHAYGIKIHEGLNLLTAGRCLGPFVINRLFFHRLKKIISKTSPEIIFVRHPKLAAALLKDGHQVVYEAHALFQDKHPDDAKIAAMEREIASKALGIIFTTNGLKNRWLQLYKDTKTTVIPNGTFYNPDLKKNFHPGRLDTIYYVGSSYYPWKGLDTLYRAVEIIDNLQLELIGEFDPLSIPTAIRQRVRLHGYVSNRKAREILQSAEITVLPNSSKDIESTNYTSPLKLFDYMAACTAVIASDLPSIRELVSEEQVVFFRPDDHVSLRDAIVSLTRDGKLRGKLAVSAWKHAEKYSWDARARQIRDFFVSITV